MIDRIDSALRFLSSDDREQWITIGFAIKSEMGDSGFETWDGWSMSCASYCPKAAKAAWRSFRHGAVTIASLFHLAKLAGWKDDDKYTMPSAAQLEARRAAAAERNSREGLERARLQRKAALKANWILSQCELETHAYLDSKGWPDMKGLVWRPAADTNLLVIPMRHGNDITGCQLIDRDGKKQFLRNQRSSGASYVIGNAGDGVTDWHVEGYCTGLSLNACLNALKVKYRIFVWFSAGNLQKSAVDGYVVADREASGAGVAAAKATGLPFWVSETPEFDLNDQWRRDGTFRTSQELRKFLLTNAV